MQDFKITNSGDLAFSNDIFTETMTIKFVMAKYPSFLLSFKTEEKNENIKPEGFTISFDTNKQPNTSSKFASVKENNEIAQAIRIRIRSELGELRNNSSIGSVLLLHKHKRINSEEPIEQIKSIINNIVSNITEEEFYVEVVQENGSGNFYCQNITVYIYLKNELIYQFQW
jgi:hypothetical protein